MTSIMKFCLVCALFIVGSVLLADDGQKGTVITGPNMMDARSLHTATRLEDGRVLIVGGMVTEGEQLDSAEVYDPQMRTFALTESLLEPRLEHSATLLMDGRVLIAGGWGRDVLSTTELYDPETSTFTQTGSMTVPRSGFTATLLHDGRVLMVGGYDNHTRQFLTSAEIYDPQTGLFSAVKGELHVGRIAHTATLLDDGRVLIVGGGTFSDVWSSAELYDPQTEMFTLVGDLSGPRYKHGAARLPDGRILIVGGSTQDDWTGMIAQTEMYDPRTETFSPSDSLGSKRFKLRDAVVVLDDGRVLIAGGSADVELYDPDTDQFVVISGEINSGRFYTTATPLENGAVLIAGGYNQNIRATMKTWLFYPEGMN